LRTYTTIVVADTGPIRTITLHRPEHRNAMTPEMQLELLAAVEDAAVSTCRVLVLSGAGNAFCSGLDLTAFENIHDKTALEHRADAERLARLFLALYELPLYMVLRSPAEQAWPSSATLPSPLPRQNLDSLKCASDLFPQSYLRFSPSRSATSASWICS